MPGQTPFEGFGRVMIIIGVVTTLAGAGFLLGGRHLGLGRLPGDILIRRGNFTFYFPVVTMLLLSTVLTILLNLVFRRR
ncbi:MAG TPA: DUF2905 domain-containing protein [Bacillota bacterium]|jgi:hypothetical protein